MSEAKTVAVLTQDLMNAQVGVLGSMLIDEECVGFVLSRVSERDFVTQQYRSIFRTIKALFREGLPTDAIAVREKLGGKLGDGWSKLLTGIMDYTPTAANVDGYVQMLKEKSALYQLQELGAALQNAADMNEARSILDKAMQLQVGRPGIHALTFAKGYEEFFDRHSGETAVEHLDWAILQLNEVLKTELGNIVIIGAYPGDGKTALALQCAARFGRKHNVGYFSFESKSSRLYDRHVARETLISSSDINDNKLTEEDFKTIIALKDKLSGTKVTLIDAVGMTALDIVAYSQAQHFDVVFVDYLQQVEPPHGVLMKDFERVTSVSRELQKFAVRTNTAVISLSQLSRPDKVKVKYKDQSGKDQVRSITPDFPYVFDVTRADRILRWFGQCNQVRGVDSGKPIQLEPWQVFDLGCTYGWVDMETGARRFNHTYNKRGRGNYKSTEKSGQALYHMCGDAIYPPYHPEEAIFEREPEVECAAVDRGQAMRVFGDAKKIAEASPNIARRLYIPKSNPVVHRTRGGFMRALSKDTKNKDSGAPSYGDPGRRGLRRKCYEQG